MSKNSLTESYIKLAELKIPHVDLSAAYAALNIQDIYTEAYRKLLEGYQTSITQLQKQVADSFAMSLANFSSVISESTRHAMEVSNKAILQKIMHSDSFCKAYEDYCTPNSEDEDYVTIEESVAKEYDFPENIAIPVGKNRVRIKTSTFLALIGLIFSLVSILKPSSDAQMLSLLKEQNQILSEVLENTESPNSTTSKELESIKETLSEQNSYFADIEQLLEQQNEVDDTQTHNN